MEGCKHPTVMKDLCAECGADLREEFSSNPDNSPITQANVPMVHSIPELKVTAELAEKIGREDKERLLKDKQLVLLVDLDQTIVHTTNDTIPANMEVRKSSFISASIPFLGMKFMHTNFVSTFRMCIIFNSTARIRLGTTRDFGRTLGTFCRK